MTRAAPRILLAAALLAGCGEGDVAERSETPAGAASVEAAASPESTRAQLLAESEIVSGQTLYVPVYSRIYTDAGRPELMAVTLSVRNADPDASIIVTRADYYDTAGKLLRQYLKAPIRLGPLATQTLIVELRETQGGSGANFIIDWVADREVVAPVVESVMAKGGAHGFGFVSRARVIASR